MPLTPDTAPAAHAFRIQPVPPGRPWVWLARGWVDLLRCPLPGLVHGLTAACFGALLLYLARDRFWLLAGSFSGFLLVAPLVATGLYAVSRALEQGQRGTMAVAWAAWKPRDHRLVVFGLLLALAGTGWVLTSAALITRFAAAPVNSPIDFLRVVVLDPESYLFEIWLVLGSVLAAPMFASSVVAIPMLLDRPQGVLTAVTTSASAVLASPLAMALWATLLLTLTLIGMATFMVGLIVVVPWLAHSSWHAYRDLVQPQTPEMPEGR
jgi:uncharacterized membrane protein